MFRPGPAAGRAATLRHVDEPPDDLTAGGLVARLRAAGCVYAEDEAALLVDAASGPAELAALAARRCAGERLEDVLGWAEFCGARYRVSPGVFVPRHRTEFLARLARERLQPGDTLVDLCCGTGALAGTLARWVPGLLVHAADLDPAAAACARENLPAAAVHVGDLFDALPAHLAGAVDVVVANVPYVPHDEVALLPPEAREGEDLLALDGGADGLDVLRRVCAEVPRWLVPGGTVLFEVSARQAATAVDTAAGAGLDARAERSEEFETTVLLARRPARAGSARG